MDTEKLVDDLIAAAARGGISGSGLVSSASGGHDAQGVGQLRDALRAELAEAQGKFIRAMGVIGEELGKRQCAERDRDAALAAVRLAGAYLGLSEYDKTRGKGPHYDEVTAAIRRALEGREATDD